VLAAGAVEVDVLVVLDQLVGLIGALERKHLIGLDAGVAAELGFGEPPTDLPTRSESSPAALLENVSAKISDGRASSR
jgi:hypothetical protein